MTNIATNIRCLNIDSFITERNSYNVLNTVIEKMISLKVDTCIQQAKSTFNENERFRKIPIFYIFGLETCQN